MAIPAVVARDACALTEVFQYVIPETGRGLAVSFHNLKPVGVPLTNQFDVLSVHFLKTLLLKQELIDHHILRREQQDTLGILTVTPGASRLLIVVLHTLGHVVMDNKPDVRLVNSHTKGIGRHHYRRPVIDKIILILLPYIAVDPRMVTGHGNPASKQHLIECIHILPRRTVYDPALIRMLPDIICHKGVFLLSCDMLDTVIQILPVESCDHHTGMV